MLLFPQKKKITSIVIEKLTKKPEQGSTDFVERLSSVPAEGSLAAPEEEKSLGKEAVGAALLRAIDKKDVKALVSSLSDFMYMCSQESPEEEMED